MGGQSELDHLRSLLDGEELIEPGSSTYAAESTTWSSQQNKHPQLVIRPKTLKSLSSVVAYLSTTDLEIDVRSQGFGNASSKDVLISLSAFDDFDLDLDNKVLTLGAGQPWKNYYDKMHDIAPDWTVVSCRTPCIGIGGSVLHGGYSWLSAQYGCASDPKNMLDAQVVKLNGEVIWASTDPDLMWALRGGGGGWGVVTAFKFRVYPAPKDIFCGPIIIPRTADKEVAKGIATFDAQSHDPRVSLFIYVLPKALQKLLIPESDQDMLVVHAFDSAGEKHARSGEGFKWALDIPGAIDMTRVMNMRDVSNMQADIDAMKGQNMSLWSPTAAARLTEENLLRGLEWFDKVQAAEGSVATNAYFLFELRSTTTDTIAAGDTAYPRVPGMRHVLLIGTGAAKDASAAELDLAEKLLLEGPSMILGPGVKQHVVANGIEHFHNMRDVYGENYDRLQSIKRRYDPRNRLGGPISPFDGPKFGER